MEGILSKLASWGPFQEFLDQLGCNAKGFFKQLVSRILGKVGCFVAGTPVQIAIEATDLSPADRQSEPFSTTTKPIEQIKVGDLVISRDAATGQTSAKRVTATKVRTVYELVKVALADATGKVVETIEATPEHPFYVEGKGFTPAGRLAIGNSIVTRAGPTLSVKQLEREARPEGVTVYNFTVAGDHTYFVGLANGGIWVHNNCWTSPGGLIYETGSAEGNRWFHVLMHLASNAAKKAHHIFLATSESELIALLDEAWARRGIAVNGDPGAYIIDMGRVISTAGQRFIKIVVKPGTTKVISAYPVWGP